MDLKGRGAIQGKPNAASGPVSTQELRGHEKRLTTLFVATAILFGFIGSIIGAFTLAHLSGIASTFALGYFPAHPFLQIFGFIAEFVMGVAYSLLPRFKSGRVPRISLAYLNYAAMTAANLLFLLSSVATLGTILERLAVSFFVAAAAIFLFQTLPLALRKTGGFPEVNPFMMLSSIALLLSCVAFFIGAWDLAGAADPFSTSMLFLELIGFAGSMIYTVQIRSVSFRQCDYRKRLVKLAWSTQAGAIGLSFIGDVFLIPYLALTSGIFFLVSAIEVILAIKIFEFAHPLMYRPAMTKMHFQIVRYNEVCLISGSIWSLVGCVLGLVESTIGSGEPFFVRDFFIHSIAIGFIGSTITCFAPMLLPSLLGRKAPVTGLSLWPIRLLNIGLLLRLGGDVQTLFFSGSLPSWEALSGPAILGAMISLLLVLRRVGKKQPGAPKLQAPVAGGVEALKDVRDATLFVKGRKTGRELVVSVWHAEKEGVIYLLPLHGSTSQWYKNAQANPDIRVVISTHAFAGKAKTVVQKKEVRKIIRLFEDKYGGRVYKNFYGENVDCAVTLVPE